MNPNGYNKYVRAKAARASEGRAPEEGEVVVGDEEFFDLEDGEEEARVMRMSKPVAPPSDEEVRQHNLSHCRYRSWCPVCVAGAANDEAHHARPPSAGSCPEVGSDYAFLRNRRGDNVYRPILVSKYRAIGPVAAHMVPSKGVGGEWIVQLILRDLQKSWNSA